ncbi:hypothetical protein L1987_56872 [Smallanthus sonchifolius]|uniref:Uncharacterized protein n=1 Tax=Smallanthus sonchifolius TaxID=185202 RepID=A0ACB9DB85_9ASTR|nr:hypothetical protein L1987_56872 [Smallanthus sonchifolius]
MWILNKVFMNRHGLLCGNFIGNNIGFDMGIEECECMDLREEFREEEEGEYGSNGMYKSLMFGNTSTILIAPDVVRKVLMDEDTFQQRWPDATIKLAGRKSFIGISNEEHKRLRKVTKTPINGHEALSIYVPNIEANVVSALEKWSQMVPDRTPEGNF